MKEENVTLSQCSSDSEELNIEGSLEAIKRVETEEQTTVPQKNLNQPHMDSSRTITELDSSFEDDLEESSMKKESMESKTNLHGRWTNEEHNLFLEGLVLYGNEWKQVQNHIITRSATQARSHAQKFFIRIRKNLNSENDLGKIKQFILRAFTNLLGDKFKPKNLNSFLDMMVKLVFSEVSIQKIKIPSLKYKIALKNKKSKKSKINSNKIKKENAVQSPKKNSGKTNKNTITKKMNRKSKSKIFLISKDQSHRNSFNIGSQNNQFQNELNRNFQTLSKNFQIQPPYINILTINMVNNMNNNYVNQPTEPKEGVKQSDPFNLEFDSILPKSKNISPSDANFFNNNYNNIQDDNDMFSLFDFH